MVNDASSKMLASVLPFPTQWFMAKLGVRHYPSLITIFHCDAFCTIFLDRNLRYLILKNEVIFMLKIITVSCFVRAYRQCFRPLFIRSCLREAIASRCSYAWMAMDRLPDNKPRLVLLVFFFFFKQDSKAQRAIH